MTLPLNAGALPWRSFTHWPLYWRPSYAWSRVPTPYKTADQTPPPWWDGKACPFTVSAQPAWTPLWGWLGEWRNWIGDSWKMESKHARGTFPEITIPLSERYFTLKMIGCWQLFSGIQFWLSFSPLHNIPLLKLNWSISILAAVICRDIYTVFTPLLPLPGQ